MNRQEIEKILRYREPYLMIDSVNIDTPGRSGTGLKDLSGDEYFFEGHFPDRPVMPGVLIVEAISQTAMVVSGESDLMLKGVEKIKFRQTIEPGDRLEITVSLTEKDKGIRKFHGEVVVGENIAASGEVILEKQVE